MIKGTLNRPWDFFDYTKSEGEDGVEVPPGEYEFERIRHPQGLDCDVLVIKGTTTYRAENSLRAQIGARNPKFSIVLEENGQLMTKVE